MSGAILRWQMQGGFQTTPDPTSEDEEAEAFSFQVSIICDEVVLGATIPEDVFRFKPQPGMTKVDSLIEYHDPRPGWEERTSPTVALADGSIEDLEPQRLVKSDEQLHPLTGLRAVGRADTDGDGIEDIMLAAFSPELVVVSGASGELTTITLLGRAPQGSICQVLPLPLAGETAWLVIASHYRAEGHLERSTCSLHGPDGDEWWVYSPELPAGVSARMQADVADLDGDGEIEVVVAVSMLEKIESGRNSYTLTNQRSLLIVLDQEGRRLAQQTFDGEAQSLQVTSQAGVPARIIITGDHGVTVLQYDGSL